ncbi:MAG: protein kinase [Gemmataceae bacterium]|nr:protein kinase [Gemmataceae bacterium]
MAVSDLLTALRAQRLLEPERLDQVQRWSANFHDPKLFAKDLVQRGWLTAFQVNKLLQGRGGELVLGQYVLLERLGEGGMGEVFKARHTSMDRIVALKVVRKELSAKPDAMRRFQREVRLVAQLHHPNIVLAFDADQVNGRLILAMEYVEGTDLGRLVKARGPMAVREACDAIRQAAMGLQHAGEKGLVHRDIKPTNLLRANQGGVVKLLDLGLARLQESEADESSMDGGGGHNGSFMTQAGRIMGTPDYISPEQARNSHTVDIRSDLYSLGCTFYYLLLGWPPFPGGPAIEKLMRHQTEPAKPVEQLRPDVPPAIGGIVRKLLAKQPEARYQSPSELVAALTTLSNGSARKAAALPANARETFVASRAMVAAMLAQAIPAQQALPTAQAAPGAIPTAVAVPASNGSSSRSKYPAATPVVAVPPRPKRIGLGWILMGGAGFLMLLASLLLLSGFRFGADPKSKPPSTSRSGPRAAATIPLR